MEKKTKWLSTKKANKLTKVAWRILTRCPKRPEETGARDAFLILCCLLTGLRLSELSCLTWGDFCFESDLPYLSVRRGKRGKRRNCYVPPQLLSVYQTYRRWCRLARFPLHEDACVFPSNKRKGMHLSNRALQYGAERIFLAAKLKGFSVHSLRHTFATHLYNSSGNDLTLVQDQLGHDSPQTTMLYIGTLRAAIADALKYLYAIAIPDPSDK